MRAYEKAAKERDKIAAKLEDVSKQLSQIEGCIETDTIMSDLGRVIKPDACLST